MVIVTGAMSWSGCIEPARIPALRRHRSTVAARGGIDRTPVCFPFAKGATVQSVASETPRQRFGFLRPADVTIKTRRSFFAPYRATPDMVPGQSRHWQAPSRKRPDIQAGHSQPALAAFASPADVALGAALLELDRVMSA
jgi:hypothetical protein